METCKTFQKCTEINLNMFWTRLDLIFKRVSLQNVKLFLLFPKTRLHSDNLDIIGNKIKAFSTVYIFVHYVSSET